MKHTNEQLISKRKVQEARIQETFDKTMDDVVAPMAERMRDFIDADILKSMSEAARVMDEKHVPQHARYKVINGVTHKRVSTCTYPFYEWHIVCGW
jgi:hypothetical protein